MPEDIIEIKSLVENLGKDWEQFKQSNDQRLKEVEKKGSADVLTTEKLSRIDKSVGDLQEKLDQAGREMKSKLDAVEKQLARPRGEGGEDPAAAEEKKQFLQLLRKGDARNNAPIQFEAKDLTVGNDAGGGYYVTPTFANRIVERIFETTPIRDLVTIMTTSGDDIEFFNNTADIPAGWVGETQTRTQTAGMNPGKIRIPVNEVYAAPQVSQKLLDDAYFDVESYLINKIADKLSRIQNTAFISGSGINQPRGMLNYPATTVDDGTRPWGTVQYVPTTVAGGLPATNPGDVFVTLMYKLKTQLLAGASWLLGRDSLTLVRQAKNSVGGYLWQPSYQAGQPSLLLDYPVTIAPDMPAVSSNGMSVVFGNFKQAYTIVDRFGLRILRDPYSVKPEVQFYSTQRVGGDLVNSEAIKLLSFTAS